MSTARAQQSVVATENPSFPAIRWIHPEGDWPSFSPDGLQVVFTMTRPDNGYSLYIMNSDGTGLRLLYPPAGTTGVSASRPDWSWNPDAIAFACQAPGRTEIYTISPDGTGAAPYYQGEAPLPNGLIYPSWYRNCEALVAVGYTGTGAATQAQLYKLTPLSSEVLTTSPYPVAGRPSVSPDGEKIAFAGNWGEYSQAQNQIWVVEPPDKPFRLEKGDDLSAIQGRSPNWSPFGDLIVFESTRPFLHPDPCTALAIWLMNSDGTPLRQLTDRALFSAYHAEWSRQQTQIVFAGQGQGIGIIDFAAGAFNR